MNAYDKFRLVELTKMIMELAQAYHDLAHITSDQHRHNTVSFASCFEETCVGIVKQCKAIDIEMEPKDGKESTVRFKQNPIRET